MKAETAYNVYLALSPKEEKRFKQMIGVTDIPKKPKNKISISDAEATEHILKFYSKNKLK